MGRALTRPAGVPARGPARWVVLFGVSIACASAAGAAKPHSSWRSLDSMSAAAAAPIEAADQLEGETAAWGDPSTGCFGMVQTLRSRDVVTDGLTSVADAQRGIRGGLERGGAAIESWTAERGEATGSFRTETFHGRIKAQVAIDEGGGLRVISAVCFFNERDVARSERRCKQFLDTL